MRRRLASLVLLAGVGLSASPSHSESASVRLYAVGSLKAALTEVAAAFAARYGTRVEATFGASGLLRQRLEQGEPADVFASADTANPLALERAGKAGPVVAFARNRMCALVRPGLDVTSETLMDRMLDPSLKLATSTPGADPAGDYAWEIFRKADALRPGARASLEGKALKLTGGPEAASPPPGVTTYAWHIREGRADLFLTYCTNARLTVAEVSGATMVQLPPGLATGATYGLTLLKSSSSAPAAAFAMFVLSHEGQALLSREGFTAPLLGDQ